MSHAGRRRIGSFRPGSFSDPGGERCDATEGTGGDDCGRAVYRGFACWALALALLGGLVVPRVVAEPATDSPAAAADSPAADSPAAIAEFVCEPGTHGAGRLIRQGSVPVVVVRGTPEEMGEQLGTLLAGPLQAMSAQRDRLLERFWPGRLAGRRVAQE